MSVLVRRSNLMVPVTDAERVGQAWRHNADAITLDLEDGVVAARKAEARGLIRAAIAPTGQGAAVAGIARHHAPASGIGCGRDAGGGDGGGARTRARDGRRVDVFHRAARILPRGVGHPLYHYREPAHHPDFSS